MNEVLEKVFGAYKRNGEYLTLKAITEVVLNRNFHKAKINLLSIKKEYRDTIWYLNIGYLDACLKNEIGALENYHKAIQLNYESDGALDLSKVSKFESFIFWYIEDNKDPLLYYLLGVLNDYFKGDLIQAANDYRNFLETNSSGENNKSKRIAEERLDAIQPPN